MPAWSDEKQIREPIQGRRIWVSTRDRPACEVPSGRRPDHVSILDTALVSA